MKRIAIALAVVITISASAAVHAKDVPVGKDASVHSILATQPDVEVVTPYNRAVKTKRLGKNDTAYWHAAGGRYMTDGNRAYLWCAVYKQSSDKAKYHWIAINDEAFDKAMSLAHQFEGGVAFYMLTRDGKGVRLTAYPYSTLDAITRGEKIVNVRE